MDFVGVDPAIVELAKKIRNIYDNRGYGGGLIGTPGPWEQVGQAIAKLNFFSDAPEHDLTGKKREKQIAVISAFDLQTESFPANFDVSTGEFKPVGLIS